MAHVLRRTEQRDDSFDPPRRLGVAHLSLLIKGVIHVLAD